MKKMGNEFKIKPENLGLYYIIEGKETLVSQARTGILVSRKELIDALAQLPDRGSIEIDLHNQILIQNHKEKTLGTKK